MFCVTSFRRPQVKINFDAMAFSVVFAAVAQCKKVYDVANNVRKVPEEAYVLWQQLDALEPIVRVAIRLNTHEATWVPINKALELIHEVVAQCGVLLARADPDGRPTETESWDEWWNAAPQRATERISRIGLIPKMQSRLQAAVGLLQAALSASIVVQNETLYKNSLTTTSPEGPALSTSALIRARKILHLFEGGRLDACGTQYQLGTALLYTSTANSKARTSLGRVALVLRRTQVVGAVKATPPSFVYELLFLNADALADTIAAQQATGVDGVMASSRLLSNVAAPSPKIEAVLQFAARQVVHVNSPKQKIGPADGALLRVHNASDNTTFDLEAFASCCIPSQLCYFPSSSETYRHVTIEVAQSLLLFCAAMAHTDKQQIDAALPTIVDEGDDAETQEKDRATVEAFLSTFQ